VLNDHGLVLVYTAAEINWFWRSGLKGSDDMKHVEVWLLGKQRIDVFFLK
jgi:hypothetical protein